jgi:hypothetical protein
LRITRARMTEVAFDLLPGLMVFVLIMASPPPREAVPWIAMAYSPMLLWALIRKADADSRLFGVPFRSRPMPIRIGDLVVQAMIAALLVVFVDWLF